jgi:hypothetical protein
VRPLTVHRFTGLLEAAPDAMVCMERRLLGPTSFRPVPLRRSGRQGNRASYSPELLTQEPGVLSQTLAGSKFWIHGTYTALCTKDEW